MPGLSIEYHNFSSFEWVRDNWHIGAGNSEGVNWSDELTEQPKEKLSSHLDSTNAAANSAQFSSLVEDALWMVLGFGTPTQGSVAVALQQYMHVLGYGPQATWSIWDKGAWHDQGDDASAYTWTFEKCWALATPKLSNEGASIVINIHNIGER
jgi:hypothetical protein